MYARYSKSPLRHLQTFHKWMHAETSLNTYPFLGIMAQVILVFVVIVLTRIVLLA